jgi:tetratricopeptide (TPR) repeat protein
MANDRAARFRGAFDVAGGPFGRRVRARIESEDAAAPALLEELRERLDRDPNAPVADDARFVTGGVVRALEQLTLEQRLVDPFLAERIARVACSLAEALPDDDYPGNAVFALRGRAWVLHAGMCMNIDRYDEAFAGADRAQRAYERLADPGTGMAEVKLTRAILFKNRHRFSDGLPLANEAAEEYQRRGDRHKYAGAIEVAASILYAAGDYASALKVFRACLQAGDELHDDDIRARALHNVGLVHRRMGDLGNAAKYLLDALHIWEGLGMKVVVAHCRWSIGLVALARADFEHAEKVLRAAIAALREVGAERVAADAKLDLAEALLMLGRPQEIETLCSEAEAYYARAGVMTGRLEAARFLRNAAANQMLGREDIQHVRMFLAESRETPDMPFASPRKKGPAFGH